MRVIGEAPKGAVELVEQVCKDNARQLPKTLKFIKRNRSGSSGNYSWYYNRITICYGTDEKDLKHVILHELGHHMNAKSRKYRDQGHTVRFWKFAFQLYDSYGDIQYAAKREKNYKAYSAVVYERYYKKD